jgi:transcriptional regulator with XRE-family HTH domain
MLVDLFARNVKKYRRIRGISQEKLAEMSGLHRTHIAGIESTCRNASLKTIEKIANALGVEPATLLEESYDK